MNEKGFVSAVIVAAGSSRRMGGINKLLLTLLGKTVLERTVEAFDKNENVNEIVLAARAEDIEEYTNLLSEYKKVKCIVEGGQTRQKSVATAVAACDEKCTLLAIHDGARPLVSQKIINDTVAAAYCCGAAACAVEVKDTIKIIDENSFITDTPERATLRAVHTPQCFDKKLYLDCIEQLGEKAKDMTDDCRLAELCGKKVRIVASSYTNIKITTAEDIPFAESILKGE
ncbi:MAG: 2-C-methyl-D-erythritol 4-phosphate cytidylyltransferase [Clostridia bacterium]|nr:2-C-methyl-D-erythritol 4-phosphate cytidylyltransferase [Clostridia bacterium]